MKRILLLVFAAFSVSSCDEVEKFLSFDISHSASMTIDSAVPLNLPFDVSTPDVTTNSLETFENNDTKAELVKDIRLKSVELEITAPANKSFDFLKSIDIYISTDQASEILLASRSNIPLNAMKIDLDPTDERLDDYVKAASYKLRTRITTRESLTEDVEVDAHLIFRVTADAL